MIGDPYASHPNPAGSRRREQSAGLLLAATLCLTPPTADASEPLAIKAARVAVTGHDVNRPDPFPGLGKFSWAGNIQRLASGELMLVHTAGYYHVSFAQPRLIEAKTRKNWLAGGWPLDFAAPTGGRSMATRSSDNGKTWGKPQTIVDLPLDDGAYGLLRCKDGTLLCFVNVQASWYGFPEAPPEFKKDINGLNTQQCVIRSTDDGKTWGKPIWLESPGRFYERSHAQPIQLPDGGVLWPTYCVDSVTALQIGVIHRSDDSGKTWRTVSKISRKGKSVDEPAIAKLKSGELLMVCRPDACLFRSKDDGVTWTQSGLVPGRGRFKAPRLFVLKDGTVVCVATRSGLRVFLGKNGGRSWTGAIPLDTSCYGYPGGIKLPDDSIIVSYCSSGAAPNRIYVVRFRANAQRDGLELLPLGPAR